eukprot:GHUV01041625.1.p2 GENE.GHUV01041625.1~~GHUV01041625.1.p2  ORF type:complete len:119 (-),score=24.26 GHUV01041625.1:302-658(-)
MPACFVSHVGMHDSLSRHKQQAPLASTGALFLACFSLPVQIHWFSIINSCVTVLLLTGFLTTILLRVLKNDFMKYTRDEEGGEAEEETGWKHLHGDVFRCVYVQKWELYLQCAGVATC